MLLQVRQNKRGLSLVIGYVLLIAISVVMSVIVYQWLKTYTPTESLECDDGTSLFISSINYDCVKNLLEITVKNNGKFSVNGYFIYASNKSGEELATIDLSSKIKSGGSTYGNTNSISFANPTCISDCENLLTPSGLSSIKVLTFDTTEYSDNFVKIEITPTRIQEVENKKRLISCGDSKIEEMISCN